MNISRHKTSGRIDELDGLRGLLASWVAVSHIICWCGFSNLPLTQMNSVRNIWIQFSYAAGAVDVFIILSGFVISYLLHTKPQSYRQFLTGRFFRIYPVYLICLLAGVGAALLAPFILANASWRENIYFNSYAGPSSAAFFAHPFSHLAAHLTLFFGLIPEKILPYTAVALLAPAWSISLEWQYYLAAPLMARLVCLRAGVIILGLIGSGAFIYDHFWSGAFLPSKLSLFLIGMGSYHLFAQAHHFEKFWRSSFPVIIAFVAAITFSWHNIALGIWILVFGGVLMGQVGFTGQDRFGKWLLRGRQMLLHPLLQKLGHLSYPLYLIHWPLIILLLAGLLRWRPQITSLQALCLMLSFGLPIIVGAAWLLHKAVELPMMRWGKNLTGRK